MNIKLDSIKQSTLFKDAFWALLGNAAGKGLALLASICVARFLGSQEYGVYGLLKSTLISIAIFSSFGLGYTATKFFAEYCEKELSLLKEIHRICNVITLISSIIICLVVSLAAIPISVWLEDITLAPILRWASVGIIFNAFITTQIGELAGFKKYKTIARNNIISGIVTFLLITPSAYYGGLKWAVFALLLTLLINYLINYYSISKILKAIKGENVITEKGLTKKILSFSFPVALQECMYSAASWGGMVVLIKFATYSELGIYSASMQWMSVMLFIPGALRNVALSHFSSNINSVQRRYAIANKLLLVNLVSTFVPFLVIFCCSSFISEFYGNSFQGLSEVLNICCFTAVIQSLTNVLTQEFMSQNRNWFLFWSRVARDISSLVLAYVFIISHLVNAAVAISIASLIASIVYLILLFYVRKASKHIINILI